MTKMTTTQFNNLLHMAVDKHKLDPEKTYLEITWWDHIFKPCTDEDCNNKESTYVVVFEEECPTMTDVDGTVYPAAFWLWSQTVDPTKVLHRPRTVSQLLDNEFMLSFNYVEFMFASSPIGYEVDINPFNTKVYVNPVGETVLALYVENRDSGEFRPFHLLDEDDIEILRL